MASDATSSKAKVSASSDDRYEKIKQGEVHIAELQKMTIKQLFEVAKEEKLDDYAGFEKTRLDFQNPKRTDKIKRPHVRGRNA